MATELETYTRAMVAWQIDTCIRIEQRHGLFGYPPEVVGVGLAAHDKGEDVDATVDAYLSGGDV